MKKGKKNSLEITKFAKIPLLSLRKNSFEAVACQAAKGIRLLDWRGKVGHWRSLSAGEFLVLESFTDEKGISRASRQNAVVAEHLLVHF